MDYDSGVGVGRNDKVRRETASGGLQEGADGLSFTVLCVPKGMHCRPRVRDEHTAAVLVEDAFAVMKTYNCE